MNIHLSSELEQLVARKVQSGRYGSADEVLQEALLLLERRDEIGMQVEEGWQSAKRGELVDGDEVFDRLDAELETIERSRLR